VSHHHVGPLCQGRQAGQPLEPCAKRTLLPVLMIGSKNTKDGVDTSLLRCDVSCWRAQRTLASSLYTFAPLHHSSVKGRYELGIRPRSPRGAVIPRPFKAPAIDRSDRAPSDWIERTIGCKSAALIAALAALAARAFSRSVQVPARPRKATELRSRGLGGGKCGPGPFGDHWASDCCAKP
jgi:hypothetical protein